MSRKVDAQPALSNASFADLLESGNFVYVDDGFKPECDPRWRNKGDHVRGDFTLIDMGRSYRKTELPTILDRESQRQGRTLLRATAYELEYFANNEWNGSGYVAAFGSLYASPNGKRYTAILWSNSDSKRRLGLRWADSLW